MRRSLGWILVLTSGFVFAQQKPKSPAKDAGARELYYFAASNTKETLAPIKSATAKAKPVQVKDPAPKDSGVPKDQEEPLSLNAVKNLGFRYSISLWNEAKAKAEPVDSDRIFHKGECFVLNFEANRSGYLYVLAKQSDGTWMPLLPNPQMPDEKNIVDPGQKMRIPSEYCFKVEDPAGSETLFVVLSRDPRDVYDLNEAIKSSSAPSAPPAPVRPAGEVVQTATARITKAVDVFRQFNGTRNLSFQKTTDQPQDPQEAPFSKYVVSSSEKPVSKVVAQIEIQHR
jgi:hypothetical protein